MFRIGGSANDGIMSMAVPKRAGYQEPTGAATTLDNYKINPNDPLYKEAMRNAAMMNQFAGSGRSEKDRALDLLLRGSIRLASERPAGNIFSTVAKAFQEPVDQYLKSGETEDNFQRQLKLAGLTSAMTSADAEKLARLKIKQEGENEEVVTLTKLLQLSGVQNPYAVAKTQIDFKKRHGEDIATTPVNRDEKGKLSARQLAGISTGQVFLINDPKSGLITARKTDESGNFQLIDPLTNKIKVPPAVVPPKTYSEILAQNPLSIRRNTLMQQYLKKEQEKKKNTSSMGD
jgi:hypothetical protein